MTLSHRSLKLSSLFKFFFLSVALFGWVPLPYLPCCWFIQLHLVCYQLLVYFPVQLWLLFSTLLYFLSLLKFSFCSFFSWVWWASLPLLWTPFLIEYLCFIKVFEVIFPFHLEHIPLFPYYIWLSVFLSLYWVKYLPLPVLGRWALSFKLVIALSCLSNLFDCLSSLDRLRVLQDPSIYQRECSQPEPRFRLSGKQILMFKVC